MRFSCCIFNKGSKVTSFEGLASLGMDHFKSTCLEPVGSTIGEAVQVAQFFPRFVDADENRDLMEEVFVEELKVVLSIFQKDKIPRSNG